MQLHSLWSFTMPRTLMHLGCLIFLLIFCKECYGGGSPPPLFVFGDSYADTGNHDKHDPSLFTPWRPPYGLTWPQHPSGRFSDGHMLTDLFASFLNISTPLPYQERNSDPNLISKGMNFAFGGSGVFQTYGPQYITFHDQINQFQHLIKGGSLYSRDLLAKSAVLIVYAGNDYVAYLSQHPNPKQEGILLVVKRVVKALEACLKKLHKLGFTRFAVTNMEPAGCVPLYALPNYTACNTDYEAFTALHNHLLHAGIRKFQKLQGLSDVLLLNQHKAFLEALKKFGLSQHKYKGRILEPCCLGVGKYSCGDTDSKGTPLYSVCPSPQEAFFWDSSHPTQAGWTAVTQFYKSDITASFGNVHNLI